MTMTTRRGSWLLLFICAQCDAMRIHTFPRSHACACSSTLPRAPPVHCKDEPARTLQAGEVIGYALLLNFFSTPLTVFLTQRGLITPPPFNTFTAIANKAMEEAIANGEIDKLMGTMCTACPLDPSSTARSWHAPHPTFILARTPLDGCNRPGP